MTTPITETTILTIDLLADVRPERFTGTPEQIITAINASAFCPHPNPQAFMARFNQTVPTLCGDGRTARTDSYAAFLEDMITLGAATRVDDDNLDGYSETTP